MNEDNSVFIGRKPAMNYVLAVVTQFNKGSTTVIVKARGKSISRAVDTVEIVRKRFITNLKIDDITIGTESLMLENKSVNVSSMEITVSKTKEEKQPVQEKVEEMEKMVPEEKAVEAPPEKPPETAPPPDAAPQSQPAPDAVPISHPDPEPQPENKPETESEKAPDEEQQE